MRTWFVLGVAFCAACGAKPPPLPGQVEQMGMQGAQIQFTEAEVRATPLQTLQMAVAQSCNGPCDRAYAAISEDTAAVDLHKFASLSGAQLHLVPPSGRFIELDSEAECATEIELQSDGLIVLENGERTSDATGCDRWDASVCRDEEGIDWPRLRSLLGDREHVCVDLGDDPAGELATLHETLRLPTVRLVQRADESTAKIESAVVDAMVDEHRSGMRWCYDAETPQPPPMRFSVEFIAAPDGGVTRAVVSKRVGTTPQVEKCVLDVVHTKFRFPETASPRTGSFELRFEP